MFDPAKRAGVLGRSQIGLGVVGISSDDIGLVGVYGQGPEAGVVGHTTGACEEAWWTGRRTDGRAGVRTDMIMNPAMYSAMVPDIENPTLEDVEAMFAAAPPNGDLIVRKRFPKLSCSGRRTRPSLQRRSHHHLGRDECGHHLNMCCRNRTRYSGIQVYPRSGTSSRTSRS